MFRGKRVMKNEKAMKVLLVAVIVFLYSIVCYRLGYGSAVDKIENLIIPPVCACECDKQKPAEPIVVVDKAEPEPPVEEPVEEIPEPEPVVEPEFVLTEDEINLIALLTMAEAEGEPEEGKRLVIDTVLNRVEGKYWPNTVEEVVYQPSQFSSMTSDRVNRVEVREDFVQLVREEIVKRTNSEVVFFRTKHYHKYGEPLFQVGNHYFSKYK